MHRAEALVDPSQLQERLLAHLLCLLSDARRGAARRPSRSGCFYESPAEEQNCLYLPWQMSLTFRNPSLMTVSLMFALVTATGVSSTDGVFLPLLSELCGAAGVWPLASAIATLAAASASFLTAL